MDVTELIRLVLTKAPISRFLHQSKGRLFNSRSLHEIALSVKLSIIEIVMPVDAREWFSELTRGIRGGDTRTVLKSAYNFYLGGWYTLSSRMNLGTNIFERKWDVLIILDACRVDALREVSSEYDFILDTNSIWSVGSSSPEWIANTFERKWLDKIKRTGYISANGYVKRILSDRIFPPDHNTVPLSMPKWNIVNIDDLVFIDHVWKYGHDDELGNVDPETVTDSAIYHYRTHNPEKMIVHYQQPHTPYMGRAKEENRPLMEIEKIPFIKLKEGADFEEVWELYKDNLRLALNEVEVLLNNIDYKRAVITADHGDAFGEWSFYSHIGGFLHPSVRKVPWVETRRLDGCDEAFYRETVALDQFRSSETISAQDQLRHLGYL